MDLGFGRVERPELGAHGIGDGRRDPGPRAKPGDDAVACLPLESQREGFVLNGTEPRFTLGGATNANGTLYDADGTTIGHERVHASFRVTVGVSRTAVDVHEFRLSCR